MNRPAWGRLLFRLYAVGVVQLVIVALAAIVIAVSIAKIPARWDMRALTTRLAPLADRPADLAKELAERKDKDGLLLSVYDEKEKLIATNVTPPLDVPPWLASRTPPAGAAPADPSRDGPPPWPPGMSHPPPFGDPGPPGPHGPSGRRGPPDGRGPSIGPPPPPLDSWLPLVHDEQPPLDRPPRPPDAFATLPVQGHDGILVARFERREPSRMPPLLTFLSGLGVVGLGAFLTARWIARPLERLAKTARALGKGDLDARADLKRQDELGEVGRAFDEMAERIRALLLSEKELLANVAHELRTPLARIRVALEIAAEGDAAAARASLDEITVDLSELETLVDDILTATRLEMSEGRPGRGGFLLHVEEVAPRALAERAAERFRARHPDRTLDVAFVSDLPLLHVDPVLCRRVIDNVLENAHKYTPDPSRPIRLAVSRTVEGVVFDVEDNGIGIPDDDLPRVFTAFFRSERSRSRGTGGVGLGLTLAKRIVDAHGGAIRAKSARDAGTTVTVVFPVEALPS